MRVYLFRGLLGTFFSTGMDDLASKLRAAGHTTVVDRWKNRPAVQREAIENWDGDSVAVIGHSLGGNSASAMARELLDAGIPVAYVGTIDATAPDPAPGGGTISDNFMSHDIRAKPVPGANEFPMPHLNHIQIDKDASVHERIGNQLALFSNRVLAELRPADPAIITMGRAFDVDNAAAPVAGTGSGEKELIAMLAGLLGERLGANSNFAANMALRHEETVPENLPVETIGKPPLTPVNAALGNGIGELLNGRKTGIGILGLLATAIVPTLFPQFAPFVALFKNLGATDPVLVGQVVSGAGDAATTTVPVVATGGTSIMTTLFTALTGWGLLGKVEKWVKGRA